MLALSSVFFIFVFFFLVGYAAFSLLTKRYVLRHMFFAPALGLAITVLPIFTLNRLGLPVLSFGLYLFIFLLISSVLVLSIKRPYFAWNQYKWFALIFIGALLTTAWPFFVYGFNWLSVLNDDMVNYCLMATRVLHYGYYQIASDVPLTQDYSQAYVSMYLAGSRSGTELVLALYSAVTHQVPQALFMTLITSFYIISISAGIGLVSLYRSQRQFLLWFALVAASSSVWAWGMLIQLFAQMSGMCLFLLSLYSVFLLLQARYFQFKCAAFTAIVFSALVVTYTEMLPFLGVITLVSLVFSVIQDRRKLSIHLMHGLGCLLLFLLLLNTSSIDFLRYLLMQISTGSSHSMSAEKLEIFNSLFPFYLVPGGMAALFGIIPTNIMMLVPSMLLNVAIILGFISLGTVTVWNLRFGYRSAGLITIAFLTMLSVGGLLFIQASGFGLFKLAMYIQPFLMAGMVFVLFQWGYRYKHFILTVFVLGLLANKTVYVISAMGDGTRHFNAGEVLYLSSSNLPGQFQAGLSTENPQEDVLVIDSLNLGFSKFQTLYTRNYTTLFSILCNPFGKIYSYHDFDYSEMKYTRQEIAQRQWCGKTLEEFYFPGYEALLGKVSVSYDLAQIIKRSQTEPMTWVTSNSNFTNRFQYNEDQRGALKMVFIPFERMKNYLIKLSAAHSLPYYFFGVSDGANIAFSQTEPDYFYPGKTIVAMNRTHAFQVVEPSENSRMLLNVTVTYSNPGRQHLPPVQLKGNKTASFNIVGYGSARVFSEPVEPYVRDMQSYLALDMGRNGEPFIEKKTGLMALYGKKYRFDRRHVSTFVRDVSLVDEDIYQSLATKAPTHVTNFPQGLDNKYLEYSGFYEDGWVGDIAYVMLRNSNNAQHILVKGTLPTLNNDGYTSILRLLLDGKEIAQEEIKNDEFSIKVPVKTMTDKRQRIEVQLTNIRPMPDHGKRPVTARIDYIGFAP